MLINIELNENDLKELVRVHLTELLNYDIHLEDISIEVKSKQNYKSEWEVANFRARLTK